MPSQSLPMPSRRILLVDDDRVIRELAGRRLARSGYHVDTAEDGLAGWEALDAGSYELLITDNHMPRLSGLGLVTRIRSARLALPIIMASGTLSTEELNRNPRLEIAATLLKPFTTDQLLETVKEVLAAVNNAHSHFRLHYTVPSETFARVEPIRHWGLND